MLSVRVRCDIQNRACFLTVDSNRNRARLLQQNVLDIIDLIGVRMFCNRALSLTERA
jgi:hypothetical protein